jgi:hypothetical protein
LIELGLIVANVMEDDQSENSKGHISAMPIPSHHTPTHRTALSTKRQEEELEVYDPFTEE